MDALDFPLDMEMLKLIITNCSEDKSSKGEKTIIDPKVDSAYMIPANKLRLYFLN